MKYTRVKLEKLQKANFCTIYEIENREERSDLREPRYTRNIEERNLEHFHVNIFHGKSMSNPSPNDEFHVTYRIDSSKILETEPEF